MELILSNEGLKDRASWEAKGYQLPQYDRAAMVANTKANPTWIHFGAGNIFKAFQCAAVQKLLNDGTLDKGVIAVERMKKGEDTHDGLTVAVTLKANGTVEKAVIGSIAETVYLYGDEERMAEIFSAPSLQMASFTITEKGYATRTPAGELTQDITDDIAAGPAAAKTYMGKVAALLLARFNAGALPIAMVSMDNCSHNGSRLQAAMEAFADAWAERGIGDKEFAEYIRDRKLVSFPWSMIDKITPRPDASVREMIESDGFDDMSSRETATHSFVAPFVNAEEAQYLVIEDVFPNGKPALDKAGVIFTTRETVDKVETMKVCTCLNPLHTALAVLGCLLGFTKISEEMKDEDLKKTVEIVGYKEGLPVVVDPGVISPKSFIDEVINKRLPNPFLQDTPQRIATDTSQKLAIRFGNTIKKYVASDKLDVKDLKVIPFVQAAWCRYLMAIDDNGDAFKPSDDPMLPELQPKFASIKLGESCDVHAILQPVLSNANIMGVDLYEVGLGEEVEKNFAELIKGPGAIRKALHTKVNE